MNADSNNPGQEATGYPNEGWRCYRDAGKLSGIGRFRLPARLRAKFPISKRLHDIGVMPIPPTAEFRFNPLHPDCSRITLHAGEPFAFDERLASRGIGAKAS